MSSFNLKIGTQLDSKGLDSLQNKLQQVSSSIQEGNNKVKQFGSEMSNTTNIASTVSNALKSAYNSDLGSVNVSKFNEQLSKSGVSLKQVESTLKSAGSVGVSAWSDLSSQILSSNTELRQTSEILDNINGVMATSIKWNAATAVFNEITNSAREAYEYVNNLDSILNQIRIVSGDSAAQMASFADSANQAASSIGSVTSEYANASLIYKQQGLEGEELQKRATITSEVANITKESTEKVSQELTAVWNGYHATNEEVESYVDKLSAVGAATATDLAQSAEAISKVASAAYTTGFDIDSLNASIATIIDTTQEGASSVGNSMKTIISRMGDLKVAGEDEFGVTLGDISSNMKEMGIDILDENENLRDMTSIIEEMGDKWQGWTRAQQQAAAIEVAGKRQYNVLMTLFNNWEKYQSTLEVSQNSLGTLQEQQDTYMESTEAHMNKMKTSFEDLYQTVLKSDAINGTIDLIGELVDKFAEFEKGLGGGYSSLLQFGTLATTVFSKQLATGIDGLIVKVQTLRENVTNDKMVSQFNELLSQKQSSIDSTSGTLAQNNEAQASINALSKQRDMYADMISHKKILNSEEIAGLKSIQAEVYQLEKERETLAANSLIVTEISEKQNAATLDMMEIEACCAEIVNIQKSYQAGTISIDQALSQEKALREQIVNLMRNNELISSTAMGEEIDSNFELIDCAKLEMQIEQQIVDLYSQKGLSQEQVASITKDVITGKEAELEAEVKIREEQQAQVINQKENVSGIQKTIQGLSIATSAVTAISNVIKTIGDDEASVADKGQSIFSSVEQIGTSIGMAGLTTGNWVLALGGLGAALGGTILEPIFTNWAEKEEKALEDLQEKMDSFKQDRETFSTGIDTLEAEKDEYAKLAQGVDEYGNNISLTADEYERYQEIVQDVFGLSDDLVLGYDNEGNAIYNKNGLLEDEIELLKEKLQLEKEELYTSEKREAKNDSDYGDYESSKKKYNKTKKNTESGSTKENIDVNSITDLVNSSDYALEAQFSGEEVKDENYKYLQSLLVGDNVKEISENLLNADQEKIEKAMSHLTNEDREAFEMYLKQLKSSYSEAEGDLQVAKKEMQTSQMIDSDYAMGMFEMDYSDTYGELEDLGSETGSNLVASYVSGLKFGVDGENYEDMAGKIDEFAQKIIKLFSNEDFSSEFETLGEDFDGTYAEYMDMIKGFINEHIEDFANEDGSVNTELIESVFNLDNVELDEGKIKSFSDDMTSQIEDSIEDSVDEHGDTGITAKMMEKIFGKEDLAANMDEIFEKIDWNSLEAGTSTAEEALQRVKKEMDLSKEVENTSNNIAEISTIIGNMNGDNGNLTQKEEEAQEETLTSLEEKYEDLGDVRDRTSEEYIEKLKEIREQEEAENIDQLEEKLRFLQEKLESIDVEVDPEGFQDTMDDILDTKYEIQVAIDAELDSDIDDAFDFSDKFDQLRSMLTEDYQITFDQAQEIAANGFGAIMQNATSTADGVIQLNADTVDAYISNKEVEMQGDKQAKIAELTNEKAVLQAKKGILVQKLTALKSAQGAETNSEKAKFLVQAVMYQQDYDNYENQINAKADASDDGNVEMSEDAKRLADYLGGVSETEATNQMQAVSDADASYAQGVNNAIDYYSQLNAKLAEVAANVRNAATGGTVTNSAGGTSAKGVNTSASGSKSASGSYEKTASSVSEGYDSAEELISNISTDEMNSIIDSGISSTQDAISSIDGQIGEIDSAIAALNTSDSTLKKTADANKKNYDKSGSTSPSSGKSGSGGSGGSGDKDKQKEIKLIEKEIDAYHDLNIAIDKVDAKLKDLQETQDYLYGKKYINNLKEQESYYKKQLVLQKEKLALNNLDIRAKRSDLKDDYNVKFDSEGNIKSYNNTIEKWRSYYNNKIKSDPDNESTYKTAFETFKKSMEAYDTALYKTRQETKDTIEEINRNLHDNEVEQFTYTIELKLDTKQAKRDYLEFCLDLSDLDYDNLITDNIVQTMRNKMNQLKTYFGAGGTLTTLRKSINEVISSKTLTSAEKQEYLNQYSEDIQTAIKDMKTLETEIEGAYVDAMEEAGDAFDDHMDKYDDLAETLEHDKKLIELLYGDDAYSKYQKLYDAQNNNNVYQVAFMRSQVEYWASMEDKYEKGTEAYETWYENYTEAQDKLNSLVEDSIENLIDRYENAIDQIMSNITNVLSNSNLDSGIVNTLDSISEQWDRITYNSDKYLDTIESINGVETIMNKITTSIAEADTVEAKEALTKLQNEELNYLNEKDQLTQYDLDRAEKMYEVTLKQIALENAQNSKDSMQLKRDSQGNWTYNYTADEEQVSDAKSELEEAQYNLYDLDTQAYNDNIEEMYDIYKEWQEKVTELYKDTTLSSEEMEAKKAEYADYYGELINNIVGENQSIQSNLYDSTFSYLNELYTTDADSVNTWMEKVTGTTYDSWSQIEANSKSIFNSIQSEFGSQVQTMIDNIYSNPDSFFAICNQVYNDLDEKTEEYQAALIELETNAGTNFSNITENIQDTDDATYDLACQNGELIDTYDDMIDSVDRLYSSYQDLADSWQTQIDLAKSAAKSAEDYLAVLNKVESSNTNADGSSKSTTSTSSKSTDSTSSTSKSTSTATSTGNSKAEVGDKVTYDSGVYRYTSAGASPTGKQNLGKKVYITNISSGADYPIHISTGSKLGSGDLGWVKKSQISGFDTGGSTGDWAGNNGKLAVLHKKEIVLNQDDTSNMLKLVDLTRDLAGNLIGNGINSGLSGTISNNYANSNSTKIEIADISLPNVTNGQEFINEIKNIANIAQLK